jgi:hypothetical protein
MSHEMSIASCAARGIRDVSIATVLTEVAADRSLASPYVLEGPASNQEQE